MRGPFQGLRVVDLSSGVGGPLATMLLADYGATVCKVEPPEGDRLRGTPAFRVLNRGKRGVVADLGRDDHRARLRALLAGADVVVVSGPDVSDALGGLDVESLRADNPELIVAHLPMYGTRGPFAVVEEDEALLAALSGYACQQASYEPGPVHFTVPTVGYSHGVLAAIAIAAALFDRDRTGTGQVVEVSGLRAVHEFEVAAFIFPSAMPKIVPPMPPVRTLFPTVGYFRASDGQWFYVGALTSGQWVKLATAIGLEELLIDPRYIDGPMSVFELEPFQALLDRIEATFATKPRDHWLRILREDADVPNAPVNPREVFFAEEQVRHLGIVATVDDPEVGPTEQIGLVAFLDSTPGAVGAGAPVLDATAPWPQWEPRPRREPAPRAAGRGPLDGVQVLDVGTFIAGAFASTILGDLGADVVKVEPPTGDPWRAMALAFLGSNRNKRSVLLDLKKAPDRERLHRLVRDADVLVHNQRPTVVPRLGLAAGDLSDVNPRLVSVAVTANGATGPMVDEPAYDQVFQARSGLSLQQGGDEPVILSMPPIDHATAALGAFAALAGLCARGREGRGQHAETSMLQGSMLMGAGELVFWEGRPPLAPGGRDLRGRSALDRAYRCADDRWAHVQVRDEAAWKALGEALAAPELTEGRPFVDVVRSPWDGALAAELATHMAQRDRRAVVDALLAAGVTCVPCVDVDEVFVHAHHAANAPALEIEHAVFGTVTMPGTYATFSDTPVAVGTLPSELGADTDDVLGSLSDPPSPRPSPAR